MASLLQRKAEADWLESNVVMGNLFDAKIVRGIPGGYGLADFKGKRVLDIGAHIGSFSVYAAWKGASLVIAVEPLPRNVALLRENASNWPQQIRVIEAAAVRDLSTPRVITSGAEITNHEMSNYGHSVLHPATHSSNRVAIHPVHLIEFPRLLEYNPQIIKMDCEGTEHELLEGYVAAPEVEALLLEVHFFDSKRVTMWRKTLESLLSQGFKIVQGKQSIIEGYGQYGLLSLLRG